MERRLVVLDGEQVIAPAPGGRGAHVLLAEHGIPGDHSSGQREYAQQFQCGLVFVGLAVDPDLSDHGGDVGRVGGEQMDPGDGPLAGATHGLAVEAQLVAEIGAPGCDPASQRGFDGRDVESAQEVGECGLARRLGGPEPQGVCQRGAVVACELGDGFQRAHARECGDDHEVKNHGQRVPAPRRITRVGNRGQNLGQRRRGFHTGLP